VQDRVQPSLLDRLTDDHPQRATDSANARVFSVSRLRAAILRDVAWLLNTVRLADTVDLDLFPEIQASTLNYGIPPMSGRVMEGVDPQFLSYEIKTALQLFEPRLIADTISVTVIEPAPKASLASPQFKIEAELFAHPVPLRMLMRAEADPDGAGIRLVEIHTELA
jgi:type VI secretion system protein ImpF